MPATGATMPSRKASEFSAIDVVPSRPAPKQPLCRHIRSIDVKVNAGASAPTCARAHRRVDERCRAAALP
jgi:hypothetical protein